MFRHQSYKGLTAHYRPQITATVANGTTDSTSFVFRAKDHGAMGVMSIAIRSSKPLTELEIKVKALTARGEVVAFDGIQAHLLHKLFERGPLHAPILVESAQPLTFEVTNQGAASASVSITPEVLLGEALPLFEAELRRLHGDDQGRIPHLFLSHVRAFSLAAAETGTRKRATDMGRADLLFTRLFIGSEDEPDLAVSVEANKTSLLETVYTEQIDRIWKYKDDLNPFYMGQESPYFITFDNLDAVNAQRASAIVECYYWQ